MFPVDEYKLKMGEFTLSWVLTEDKKRVTIVLSNIPSNDQFNLLVQQFGKETEEENVWRVDLDECDPQQFMLKTFATLTRMYVDMMYGCIKLKHEATYPAELTTTEETVPSVPSVLLTVADHSEMPTPLEGTEYVHEPTPTAAAPEHKHEESD